MSSLFLPGSPAGLYYFTADYVGSDLTGSGRDITMTGSLTYTDGPLMDAGGAAQFSGTAYGTIDGIAGTEITQHESMTIMLQVYKSTSVLNH